MNWNGEWFHPSIRTTFKYVASCSHMDEWETAEWKARVHSTGKLYDENAEDNMEDDHAIHTLIETDIDVTEKQVLDAFCGSLAAGCACEHDCCGHYHGGLYRVLPFDETKRRWLLVASYGRNY